MGLRDRCGGVRMCCGRVVAGSYRVVGEVCIVDMATCGLLRAVRYKRYI